MGAKQLMELRRSAITEETCARAAIMAARTALGPIRDPAARAAGVPPGPSARLPPPSDFDQLKAALSRVHSASLAEDTDYAVLDVAGDGGDKQTLAEVFDWAGHVDQVLVTAGGISSTGPP